jgi:dolichol-phosphate mannosyltransferase
VIAWNAAHDWASFAFQSIRRLGAAPQFSLHLLIGSILLLITPVVFAAAISTVIPAGGLRQALHRPIDRKQAFIVVYTLTPLSVFAAFSLVHEVKLNWTGPLWLAVLPAVAQLIATERRPAFFGKTPAWRATIAIVLLMWGAGLHYLALGLPGVPYPESLREVPVAWRQLADAAGEIEEDVKRTTGDKPLLVGMDKYFLSSELAFYGRHDNDPVRNTAGRGLFGSDSLMYDYWFSSARQTGRTVIMFGLEPREVSDESLSKWFRKLGPVTERLVYKAGAPARRFYYRVGYDFRP